MAYQDRQLEDLDPHHDRSLKALAKPKVLPLDQPLGQKLDCVEEGCSFHSVSWLGKESCQIRVSDAIKRERLIGSTINSVLHKLNITRKKSFLWDARESSM